MAKCCGGNQKALQEIQAARAAMAAMQNPATLGTRPQVNTLAQAPVPEGHTRMRFIGDRIGPVTYYVKGVPYTGANTNDWRFVNAKTEHVDALERMGVWARVRVAPPPPPPPPPPPVTVLIETPPPPEPPVVAPPVPEPAPVPPPKPAPVVIPVAEPVTQTVAPEMVRATEYIPPAKPKRTRKAKK